MRPLTETRLRPRHGHRLLGLGLIVSGVGTIAAGVNFIATILAMRGPGMTLRKCPFFVWTMLWTSVQILLAIPPLTAALVMVLLDRHLGAHFFDAQNGGSAYLWQHLFWFFGHPEVYILILPVFGMVSEVIPVFSRKVLFGYEFMAAATDGHRLHQPGRLGASHVRRRHEPDRSTSSSWPRPCWSSIPTGIKFFNWLATMYGGRIRFASPMLFCCAFLSMFSDRRADRHHAGGGAVRLSALRQLLRGRPFPLGADRRHAVRHLRRHPLLVSQGRPAGCSPSGWPLAILAAVHRLHPDLRADARLRACSACRGGSTPTRPTAAGRSGTSSPRSGRSSRLAELSSSSSTTSSSRCGTASRPATTRGTPGRWSGRRPRRRRRTTSRSIPTVPSRRPLWDLKHPDDPDWTV